MSWVVCVCVLCLLCCVVLCCAVVCMCVCAVLCCAAFHLPLISVLCCAHVEVNPSGHALSELDQVVLLAALPPAAPSAMAHRYNPYGESLLRL